MGNSLFPFHVTMKVAGYILIHKCRQYRNSKERLAAIYVIYIFYKIGTNLRMQKSEPDAKKWKKILPPCTYVLVTASELVKRNDPSCISGVKFRINLRNPFWNYIPNVEPIHRKYAFYKVWNVWRIVIYWSYGNSSLS